MIDEFRGEYYFLSNFSNSVIRLNKLLFNNAEAAFHSFKNKEAAVRFQTLNPSEAKRLGRLVYLRRDWELVKDTCMHEVVLQKFIQNPDLLQRLLATGNQELIEGNTWHDNYWGSCICDKCRSKNKRNQLGKILMRVRQELKP